MSASNKKPLPGAELVGKAYLCRDAIVRWVTGQSTRGSYHILWREPHDDVWYFGSTWWPDRFIPNITEEVKPPGPGEKYKRCGVMGVVEEYRMPANDAGETA